MTTIVKNKNIDKIKLDKLVWNLQTCEPNHLKGETKKKSKGIVLNTKPEIINIDTDSEIDICSTRCSHLCTSPLTLTRPTINWGYGHDICIRQFWWKSIKILI